MYVATGHTGMTPISSTNNLASTVDMDTSVVEETPLLAIAAHLSSDEAIDVEQRPVRKGLGTANRNPLVRQQSAPPAFNPPPSATSIGSNSDSLGDFPDVQLRRKGSGRKSRRSVASSGESGESSIGLDPQATDQAFRKALRSSSIGPYKRVSFISIFPCCFHHIRCVMCLLYLQYSFPISSLHVNQLNQCSSTNQNSTNRALKKWKG